MDPRPNRGPNDRVAATTQPSCPVCARAVAGQVKTKSYCSVGCALTAGVPRDRDGNFPITTPLIVGLVFFFVAFNQILFAVLARIVSSESDGVIRNLFLVSWNCGLLFWIGFAVMQLRVGARALSDVLILVGAATLLAASWVLQSGGCASGGTLVLVAWGLRVWFSRKSA